MAEQGQLAPPLPAHYCKHLIDGKPFPLPDGSPGSERYLHELPIPPSMKEEIERRCRRPGYRHKVYRDFITRELLRFYYFEGKRFVYRGTPRGHLILRVFAYDDESNAIRDYKCGLDDRNGVGIWSVPDNDGTEYIMV